MAFSDTDVDRTPICGCSHRLPAPVRIYLSVPEVTYPSSERTQVTPKLRLCKALLDRIAWSFCAVDFRQIAIWWALSFRMVIDCFVCGEIVGIA